MTVDPAAAGTAPDSPGHVDPDHLADLAEGLLVGSDADAVRTHLASCELCAEDFALITLDSGLAEFLAPEPIPAEVVARVEAALYREPPLHDVASAASGSHAASHSAAQHAARPSRTRRFKLAFGALASVGLLAGGVFAGVSMIGGGAGSAESTAGKSVAAPAAGADSGGSRGNAPAAPAPNETAQIQQQAAQLLAAQKYSSSVPASPGHPDSALRTPTLMDRCSQNPNPTDTLLASAPTTYQGKAAELYVYAKAGDATHAHVVVVEAKCGTSLQSGATGQSPRPAAGTATPPSADTLAPQVLAETDITRS